MKRIIRSLLVLCLSLSLWLAPAAYAESGSEACSVTTTETWADFSRAAIDLINSAKGDVHTASVESDYESGRLIVKMEGELPDISAFEPKAIIRDPENHYLIQFSSAKKAEECAAFLETDENVIYVEPDRIVSLADEPVEEYAPTDGNAAADGDGPEDGDAATDGDAPQTEAKSWGVSAIHADQYAADLIARGQTPRVIVAVVDTGVELSHPMLSGRLVDGYDFNEGDYIPNDENGHGTHVSGTIVDCTPGLNVMIMPIRVMDAKGSGYFSTIALGIRYAAENGASVINMSFGGPGDDPYGDEAIALALQNGATPVAAAGNEAENNDEVYLSPANNEECITVAAAGQDMSNAWFSNYGSAVDLAAPGVDILSAVLDQKYDYYSGTSMATPHVAAAAAMLLCDNPGLSPAAVSSMLRNAATDLGPTGWDPHYGAGFLNLDPFIQKPEYYTVSYMANGGEGAPRSQKKTPGEPLTLSSGKPVALEKYEEFTVKLDANGGTVNPASLSALKTTRYTFQGWNTRLDGSGRSYSPGDVYTDDESMTLYAQWDRKSETSTVKLPTPTREGYTFMGWATASDATSGSTDDVQPYGSMTLYAVWRESDVWSGSWGELNWTLGKTGGALVISGSGAMDDFTSADAWLAYREDIQSVVIESGVTSVGSYAFSRCKGLTSVSIPDSVTEVGEYAFHGCAGLTDVIFGGTQEQWSAVSIGAGNAPLTDAAIRFGVVPDCVLPAFLTEIGEEAFSGAAFRYVKLPETTTVIGRLAFAECPNLRYIYIPAATTDIDRYAFVDVTDLTVFGKAGSCAETFADARGFRFVAVP